MLPTRKYDWERAEQAFISAPDDGHMTLKVISNRFGIPYQTVRRYAAKHEWVLQRDNIIRRQRAISMLETAKSQPLREHLMRQLYATEVDKS